MTSLDMVHNVSFDDHLKNLQFEANLSYRKQGQGYLLCTYELLQCSVPQKQWLEDLDGKDSQQVR